MFMNHGFLQWNSLPIFSAVALISKDAEVGEKILVESHACGGRGYFR
jgi:hypothetical protein